MSESLPLILLITLAGGLFLVLHSLAKTKRVSEAMLDEYKIMLEEARKAEAVKAAKAAADAKEMEQAAEAQEDIVEVS
jgi:hypothetical protein